MTLKFALSLYVALADRKIFMHHVSHSLNLDFSSLDLSHEYTEHISKPLSFSSSSAKGCRRVNGNKIVVSMTTLGKKALWEQSPFPKMQNVRDLILCSSRTKEISN